jgi:hypothetical protein
VGSFTDTAHLSQALHHANLALVPDQLSPLALPRPLPVPMVVREATVNGARRSFLAESNGSIRMAVESGNGVDPLVVDVCTIVKAPLDRRDIALDQSLADTSQNPSIWELDYDIGLLQISATFPLGAGQP